MKGKAASTSTGAGTTTGALIFGAALGLLGVVGLTFGVFLPHPFFFIAGALLLPAAVMTVLTVCSGRRPTSAIISIALAIVLLAAPALVRAGLTGNSVAWTATVDADDLEVINGQIFTFSFKNSAGPNQRTVRRLDPTDGSVMREWAAEAVERPSITADGGVVFTSTAVSTNEHTKIITMFDAQGNRSWQVPIETEFASDIYVTAGSGGAVHVVVCRTSKSGSDRQGCRISTIDDSGTIVDEHGIGFEWQLGDGESWLDLPGGELPRATLVTDGRHGVDMYSPETIGPIANLPRGKVVEDYGSRLTHDSLITAERLGDHKCRVVSRSLRNGAQAWATAVPCTSETSLLLWATTDEDGPLYLGLDEVGERSASLAALDPATGALTPIPEVAPRHSDLFGAAAQHLAREATAGRFALATDGGQITVRESATNAAPLEFQTLGTADTPAAADGDVLAIISDTGSGEVSPAVAHNPYLLSRGFGTDDERPNAQSADRPDFPERLTVVNATTGEELSSTIFTSTITYLTVLPGGQTVAETANGTVSVVGG